MEPAGVTFGDGSEMDFQALEKRVDGLYVELLRRRSLSKGERLDDKFARRLNPDLEKMPGADLSAELLRLHPRLYGTGRVHEPWRLLDPSFTESRPTDIQEIQQARGEQLDRAAHVVILASQEQDLEETSPGKFTLVTRTAGDRHQFCRSARFFSQPTIALIGSGYLVGPSTILTANHCLTDPDFPLEDIRFVFGFDRGDIPTELDSRSIFEAAEIIVRDEGDNDWALVRLTREVGRPPLSVRQDRIPDDEEVYVIGHPLGLPKKLAEGARVRDNTGEGFFVANLDIFGGNSGSPIFNARDHRLEGVLLEGDGFFVDCSSGCQRPIACHTLCTGEIVTRITEVFKDIRPEDLP